MRVLPIDIKNNYQIKKPTNKNCNFKGTINKSVYRYLDQVCSGTTESVAMKNEILQKLKNFMAPLHKDTTFSIENIPDFTSYTLPCPAKKMNIAYIFEDVEDYQTFFSNKKTGNSFSLSERCTRIWDKDKEYCPPEECEWKSWKDDKLSAFKSHVDAVIKFFDEKRGFDVDNVLYNNGLRDRPLIESFLPDFIVKWRMERYKKLAPQFQQHHSNNDVCIYN